MEKKPVALITGASRGIGRGIAIELARAGYEIAGVTTKVDPAQTASGIFEVKQRIEELGSTLLPVQGDISGVDHHERIIAEVIARFGRIDLLVNNAGVAPERRLDVLEMTLESYDRVLEVNLRGPVFFTQRVVRRMVERQRNDADYRPGIIFITSISAYMASPSRAEYCVSKAGLSMAATVFADRLAPFGINVYEVRPGIIKTDMTANVEAKYDKLIGDGLVPQDRWGLPEDVGKAVAALASGAFGYSTGAVVEVSGGMNLRRL